MKQLNKEEVVSQIRGLADKEGVIDLKGMDLTGLVLSMSVIKADKIYQSFHDVKLIIQNFIDPKTRIKK